MRKMTDISSCLRRVAAVVAISLLSATTAHCVESLPSDNPKYQVVKRIYDNIAKAFGDGRQPPRLVVVPKGTPERMIVAWSMSGSEDVGITGTLGDAQEGYIAVEEQVLDLFARSEVDPEGAVAFIVGHELAHFYLRHGWAGDFGNSFASLDMGKKMLKAASYDDVIRRETEADYFGGFYGYLAGYDTMGSAPRTIDLLYAQYQLPDKIANYPARLERKAIAERAGTNLRKLIPVFEGANRLLLLGKYQESARLYDYLARVFPSREMFNNAGVAHALQALRLFRPGTLSFCYPFEFDAETRLHVKGWKAKGIDLDAPQRTALLRQAAEAFDKALQRDRDYAVAKVNLAAVDALLGDDDTAIVLANQAMELAKKQGEQPTLANALVVRGIAYAAGGNRERALVDFAAAGNSGSRLAALNLAQLGGEKPAPAAEPEQREASAPDEEVIAGLSARSPFLKDKDAAPFTLQGSGAAEPPMTLYFRSGAGWDRTLTLVGTRLSSVVATAKGYAGKSARGVAIGDPLPFMLEKYGPAAALVPARQVTWHLYPKKGLAFAVDPDQKVAGWLVYSAE